jgi:hypothetical protein
VSKEHAAIVQYKLSDNQHPFRGYHEVHDASRVMSERSSFQQSLMQKYMPVIYLKKWKPPYQLPPLSAPIPDLNGMLATVLKRGDNGGGGGARAVNDVTHSNMPTPIPSPTPPYHMQVDGNNFLSTACPSTNFTYRKRFSRGRYLRWRYVRNHTDLSHQMPPTKDDLHWFKVSL